MVVPGFRFTTEDLRPPFQSVVWQGGEVVGTDASGATTLRFRFPANQATGVARATITVSVTDADGLQATGMGQAQFGVRRVVDLFELCRRLPRLPQCRSGGIRG